MRLRRVLAAVLVSWGLACWQAAGAHALISVGPAPADEVPAAEETDVELPAAAVALEPRVTVRTGPDLATRTLERIDQIRYDYRQTIFHVVERATDASAGGWLRIQIPGRPNGRTGWVAAGELDILYSVASVAIEIDRSSRRLRAVRDGRTILASPVAVGTAGAPTPIGSFYLAASFRPSNDFLGPFAFETSAYAAISDWPRGGIVGLHGTSRPGSIGRRASHGCLRVLNKTILKLRRLVPLGASLEIRP